jgi:hypothetical protein
MTEDVSQTAKEDNIKFAKKTESIFSLATQKFADANIPNPVTKSEVHRVFYIDYSELYLKAWSISSYKAPALPPPPSWLTNDG